MPKIVDSIFLRGLNVAFFILECRIQLQEKSFRIYRLDSTENLVTGTVVNNRMIQCNRIIRQPPVLLFVFVIEKKPAWFIRAPNEFIRDIEKTCDYISQSGNTGEHGSMDNTNLNNSAKLKMCDFQGIDCRNDRTLAKQHPLMKMYPLIYLEHMFIFGNTIAAGSMV